MWSIEKMITFDKSSWHRKLLKWTFGEGFFLENTYRAGKDDKIIIVKEPKIHNLCPYVRALIGSIIAMPYVALFKAMPERLRLYHEDLTKTCITVGGIASIVHIMGTVIFGFEWWYVPLGMGFITAICLGIVGLIFLGFAIADYIHRKPKDIYKQPNIIKKFLESEHSKICPSIKFSDR